ncbi:MAG: ribosomal-processing cysteine protease Prp [Clostridia bacterium]|nr:ribosomal-processing cysteine protease Prp [Clostridia bacterium]
MIRAVMLRDAAGHFTGCRVTGHSGYAPQGSDIVCAAVSALCATCVNSLEAVCGVRPELRENRDGLLDFRLPGGLSDQQAHDAQVLMKALRQGLKDVSEAEPAHMELAIQDGRKSK